MQMEGASAYKMGKLRSEELRFTQGQRVGMEPGTAAISPGWGPDHPVQNLVLTFNGSFHFGQVTDSSSSIKQGQKWPYGLS